MSDIQQRSSERSRKGTTMKALVTIQHPAHVHFFRHAIDELEAKGHDVYVFVREKDIALELLDAYDISYTVLAGEPRSTLDVFRVQSKYELGLLGHARRIDPDVLTAIGEPAITHVATLLGAKSLLFTDTEHTRMQNAISIPFADRVCTPASFTGDFGAKHVTYDGYHELAYLHPSRFTPDPTRLTDQGIRPDETYYVVRSIAWNAFHDYGKSGLSRGGLAEIVSILADRGTVYITSESTLPDEFERYRQSVPTHHIHDLLAYANGYLGDSGTMATEAALLGTPAIRVDPFVETQECGNFIELQNEYGLLFSTADERIAIETLQRQLSDPNRNQRCKDRRERLLADKIDVTDFIVEQVESLGGVRTEQVIA